MATMYRNPSGSVTVETSSAYHAASLERQGWTIVDAAPAAPTPKRRGRPPKAKTDLPAAVGDGSGPVGDDEDL